MTFNPRNITSRSAADHFDNYSRVPWSDKLSLYDFYFLTGLLPKGSREGAKNLKKNSDFFFFFCRNYSQKGKIALRNEVFKGLWIFEEDRPLQTAW